MKHRIPVEALEAIKRHKILLEISKLYHPDFRQTWMSVTEKVTPVLSADRASLWSLSKDGSKLVCEDLFISSLNDHTSGTELPCSLYPAYLNALETSRFIDASDGISDPRTSEFATNYLNPLNIKSLLDVPILKGGNLSGVICFEYLDKIRTWTMEEKEFAASLADLISSKFETWERSVAEMELAASESRYRNILDNAVIGIFRTRPDGTILFGNPALASILEFDSVEELLQVNAIHLYLSAADRDAYIQQITEKQQVKNFELNLLSHKGSPRNCIVNAYQEDGEIVGMIMDVTNQKKILEDLDEAKQRAEESDRLKTSLLANMSHELRTPMNSILGFSELLLNDSDDPETVFYSSRIHSSGRRLMNTLQAILELADLETRKSKLVLREMNLPGILSAVLVPFQAQASEKGLYLETEYNAGVKARGDENLLKLVFQNLIDNAVKFTDAGGVTISILERSFEGKEWMTIRFKDTGIGIDKEFFTQIFQEFRQASEGYNRRYEGTGLGLTLSNKMVGLMGGSITVESEPGAGSVFTVWLPASSQETVLPEPSQRGSSGSQPLPVPGSAPPDHLPIVLVVEDNDDNAELVKLYLKSTYRIDRAQDGSTALKMAKNKPYKAVLLDINLGIGMDGLNTVRELRRQKPYRKTPIIAITGYTMSEDMEKIMDAGCSHYMAKPFTKSVLLNMLVEALAVHPKAKRYENR